MHFICRNDDIEEGKSKGFTVNGVAVFGVRKNGLLHFYRNRCPHLGAEMEWMDDEFLDESGEHIRCQFHGALFTIVDGHCIAGPCKGDALTAITTREENNAIYWEPKN